MKNGTLKEIAKELNLSCTTVSVCLSGKAKRYKISPETENRVIEYAQKYAFSPNHMAQSLIKGERNTVGIMVDYSYISYNHYIAVHHVLAKLSEQNQNYVIQDFTNTSFLECLNKLKGMGVFAVLVISRNNEREDILEKLTPYLRDIKIYLIDCLFYNKKGKNYKNLYRIGIQREEAYEKVFDYLYSLGHRKIAFELSGRANMTAYKNFLEKYSLSMDKSLILEAVHYANYFEDGVAYGKKVLQLYKQNGLTAVCLHDDQSAAGLISFLENNNIKVPDDISVTGFDNIDAAPYFKHGLTTIEVPICKMIDLAIESIFNNRIIEANTFLEGKLIIRESVGKVNETELLEVVQAGY
jgi:LacI family transcriptional regulator